MSFVIYHPPAPLDEYVKCLWYAENPLPSPPRKMLPVPSLHLMVNLGSPFHVYKAGQSKPFATCSESWSVGLWGEYHTMVGPRHMQILNVSFKPGGAFPFLKFPLSELHNQIVSLDAIWGSRAGDIREMLYAAPTPHERFAVMEQLLLARLGERPYGLEIVQYAVAQMRRRHGAVSIQAMCDEIGISQKHLAARFKRMVGTTPKELARLYRFEHVLVGLDPAKPVDWNFVARRSCYHDPSHLAKDFEALTGHTPNSYLQLRMSAIAQDPSRARHTSQLPVG